MADIGTYRMFSDSQLAREIFTLYEAQQSQHSQVGVGTRTFAKDLRLLDQKFDNACKAGKERGWKRLPESADDIPSSSASTKGKRASFGSIDFGGNGDLV